jgi:hypothetical protein
MLHPIKAWLTARWPAVIGGMMTGCVCLTSVAAPVALVVLPLSAAVMPVAGAGTTSDTRVAPTRQRSQVLIQFSPTVRDPSDPVFLTTLGQAVGCSLTYLHAAAGAHVLTAEYPHNLSVASLLKRLATQPEVMSVEEDRLMLPSAATGVRKP